jgi:hypothetical protein
VRRYVEARSPDGAPFPPQPNLDEVPGPLYGQIQGNLDWWRQRRVDTFSDSAAELLLTERQLRYYRWAGGPGGGARAVGLCTPGEGGAGGPQRAVPASGERGSPPPPRPRPARARACRQDMDIPKWEDTVDGRKAAAAAAAGGSSSGSGGGEAGSSGEAGSGSSSGSSGSGQQG